MSSSYVLGLMLTLVACGDTNGNETSGSSNGADGTASGSGVSSDSGGSSASGDQSSSASTSSGAGAGSGGAGTGSGGDMGETSGGAAGRGGAATSSGGGEGGEGATANSAGCTNPDPIPEAMLPEALAAGECRVALACECSVAQSYSSQAECETARRQYYQGWQAVIQNQGYGYDAECAAKFVGYSERQGCFSYQTDWCPSVGCSVYSGSSTTSRRRGGLLFRLA